MTRCFLEDLLLQVATDPQPEPGPAPILRGADALPLSESTEFQFTAEQRCEAREANLRG